MNLIFNLEQMTNAELENSLFDLRKKERKCQIEFIHILNEMDKRKSFLAEGYTSLFAYVTQKLGYSEASAQKRIQLARHCHEFPELISEIQEGRLHMSGASVIAPHLTPENKVTTLQRVQNKSLDEIRWLVAEFNQRAFVKDSIKEQKSCSTISETASSLLDSQNDNQIGLAIEPIQTLRPIAPEQAVIKFSCSKTFVAKLKRCQELLKHSQETNFEAVIEKALDALLEKKDPIKRQERREEKIQKAHVVSKMHSLPNMARKKDSNPIMSRKRIPLSEKIRDLVFKRDQRQCSFVSHNGTRCASKTFLQVDHRKSVCHGGTNNIENLQLLCANHHKRKTEMQMGGACKKINQRN